MNTKDKISYGMVFRPYSELNESEKKILNRMIPTNPKN
jgi:hypothetical protein